MDIKKLIEENIRSYFLSNYKLKLPNIEIQNTKKDYTGDITVVVFPFLNLLKKSPLEVGTEIGNLLKKLEFVEDYNVIQGFLNLTVSSTYYLQFLKENVDKKKYGISQPNKESPLFLVEFSSPNTNKPLHLGHIRNILLGSSISNILEANGKRVHKTQIINDRGIHICKSIVAWKKFGNNDSPKNTNTKGDHFVGKYYVLFEKVYKEEIALLISQGKEKKYAEKNAPIFLEAQSLLIKWESGDKEVMDLWTKMNQWVYQGFDKTYRELNIDFDSNYYESQTYLRGKKVVEEGLKKKIFSKKPDGSVWIDLTKDGLDEKILIRSDGTSVYITQDIGTAILRHIENPEMKGMIYTVGSEQDYHFKVLFKIIEKLNYPWSNNLHHLSYGMVDLPSGKMKSREGTVVDADEIIDEMKSSAALISQELGKIDDFSFEEKNKLYKMIGLGALKYFILKVDPKKRILFNPEESIDFNGNTGPFVQYTYARIQSLLRKGGLLNNDFSVSITITEKEKEIIKHIKEFPMIVKLAGENYSPAGIINYVYDLVKSYNSYYQSVSIIKINKKEIKNFRMNLSKMVAITIKNSMNLIGIELPEKM